MANRKRNIQMKFYVTEEKKRLIDEKMAQLPTRRYGAYLRKMAIDGYNAAHFRPQAAFIRLISVVSSWMIYPSIAIFRRYAPYRRVGSCAIFSSMSRFSSSVT